jgi:hypothetical protein
VCDFTRPAPGAQGASFSRQWLKLKRCRATAEVAEGNRGGWLVGEPVATLGRRSTRPTHSGKLSRY